MVGEMVDGALASQAGMPRRVMLDQLISVVLSVFDRYPVPPSIGEEAWLVARSDLAHRLDLVGGHAPKRVMDIPEPLAESYFAMMPIHEKLRGRDFQTTSAFATSTMNWLSAWTGPRCNGHWSRVPRHSFRLMGRPPAGEGRWTGQTAGLRFCRSTPLSSIPKPPGSIHERRG
jgi:hypothetical protein